MSIKSKLIVAVVLLITFCVKAQGMMVDKGGINIVVSNKLYIAKDANGEVVEPFIHQGTTYLPIRALAEIFGLSVEWYETLHLISLEATEEEQAGEEEQLATEGIYPGVSNPSIVKRQSHQEEINVSPNTVYLMYNEQEVEMKDASGAEVKIIFSEGTNYLPIRAIANILTLEVIWEESTGTIFLNKPTAITETVLEEEEEIIENEVIIE